VSEPESGDETSPAVKTDGEASKSAADGSETAEQKPAEANAAAPEEPSEPSESDAASEDRPRKKKKKKKRRKSEGEPELTPEARAKLEQEEKAASEARERKRTRIWIGLVLTILCVELYVFGSRGQIEACVGREGQSDFSLIGAPRTEKNRAKVPMCETRYNVGMRSVYDEAREESLYAACRRATMIRGDRERAACFGGLAGWQQQVTTRFVWPWEKPFYQRMFWFIP
jgi:hypothetical protein